MELPFIIPVMILFGAFGLVYLGLRAHQTRLLHRERMAAIDKGIDIKPILLSAAPAFGHRIYLLRGLVWLCAGAALAGALAVTSPLFQQAERGPTRYCPNLRPHAHFHDEQTGCTHDIDLPPEVLENLNGVLPRGFDAKSVEITFRGKAAKSSS